jgi:hypothetical protein
MAAPTKKSKVKINKNGRTTGLPVTQWLGGAALTLTMGAAMVGAPVAYADTEGSSSPSASDGNGADTAADSSAGSSASAGDSPARKNRGAATRTAPPTDRPPFRHRCGSRSSCHQGCACGDHRGRKSRCATTIWHRNIGFRSVEALIGAPAGDQSA